MTLFLKCTYELGGMRVGIMFPLVTYIMIKYCSDAF
jgi:hypothetical protein